MKKTKRNHEQPPTTPATDHPTGKWEPGDVFSLFSLVDSPPPLLLHNQLFHSYNLDELKNELCRVEALAKRNKHPISTEQLLEQIELVELLNIPKDGVMYLKWRFEQADALHRELIYLLAKQGNKEAFKSFSKKISRLFLASQSGLANDGHEGALQSLATLAIEATEVVNKHAVKQPDIFAPVAAEWVYWPFLKSIDKKLNLIRTEDESKILHRLNSGKNTQRKLSGRNRSDPNNATMEVANRLLEYVRSIRRYAKFIYRQKPPVEPSENSGAESWLTQAAHLSDEIKSRKDGEAWWKLAERCLLQSYPALDPAAGSNLNAIAPSLLQLSKVKNPRDRRKAILKNIKRKFEIILAEPSTVTIKPTAERMAQLKVESPGLFKKLQLHGIT